MKKNPQKIIPVAKTGIKKILLPIKFALIILFLGFFQVNANDSFQEKIVTGTVSDETGELLPGANIQVEGTQIGTVTDLSGKYSIKIPATGSVLVFSYIGYLSERITVTDQTVIDVELTPDLVGLDEVVVVGYGTQKRSDITGSVASLPKERLEMMPNLNIAQAIQGAIPGVMIQTTTAGASPNEVIMIRGRNSILASNDPLIVVDGIPYGGQISDINPNNVQSVEVLKDASAAAIYGSRGSNGVILITTKEGIEGKTTITYDGKYSRQTFEIPHYLDGPEFYAFKMERFPQFMTPEEQAIYDAGEWVNWQDLAFRTGQSQEHNLSVSGGLNDTKYYFGGGLLDVKGVTLNDNFQRITSRINVESKVTNWLKIGTRTQLSLDDASGASPDITGKTGVFGMNPLTKAYDEDGKLTIYPWENVKDGNPLQPILWDDIDKSSQIVTNNYAIINFPFIDGLSYRINTGYRTRFIDQATYAGVNTEEGLSSQGRADTERAREDNIIIDNILSYSREFGPHNLFATALYSYEGNKYSSNRLHAEIFPNDFLLWYAAGQAELIIPSYDYNETNLISQMGRLNYGYNNRYLITLTIRRDGYSGFGSERKWGVFPSVAMGWNVSNEQFFPWEDLFNELKLRISYGLNGNQAVGAYQTISRLGEENMVSGSTSLPGYIPSSLGQDNLGWESSRVLNLGLDFGILKSRIAGNINWYRTNTMDLLLGRTISAVHGITSITQNIGETESSGLELSVRSRNIVTSNFNWSMSGNISFFKNKIVSLYGELDEQGNEIDDVANAWFIGKPIRVNYDYVYDGVWQTDEAEEAAKWNTQPGYVKLKDVNNDYALTAEDRQIIGQQDPKFIWGLTNSFTYKNLKLEIFVHGVHGVTRYNDLLRDNLVTQETRRTPMKKNWWTPENPTNDFYMNKYEAKFMQGIEGLIYENASFIRLKDVSLSYDFPKDMIGKIRINRLRLFITGRNLFTLTEWNGLDPELDLPRSYPLQKEYVFGINLGF